MMDRDSLFYELSLNRELDFSVAGIKLFLSPYPKSEESIFDLWDNTNKKLLIRGTLDEIFAYKVLGKYSLLHLQLMALQHLLIVIILTI